MVRMDIRHQEAWMESIKYTSFHLFFYLPVIGSFDPYSHPKRL
jgi:hypothetical protein